MIHTWLAASRAVLPPATVCGIYKVVVVGTLARPTPSGGEAQMLAVAIVYCALVQTCQMTLNTMLLTPSKLYQHQENGI